MQTPADSGERVKDLVDVRGLVLFLFKCVLRMLFASDA